MLLGTKKENLGEHFTLTAKGGPGGGVRSCCSNVQCVLSGLQVRSEVRSGLQYWCNSGDVLQVGAVVFCTGSGVPSPEQLKGRYPLL